MWEQVSNETRRDAGMWGLRSDPRIRDWPLMGGPEGLCCILAIYLGGCVVAGPRLMRNRKPWSLRPLLVAYNAGMVVVSLYFVSLTIKMAYVESGYSFLCQADDSRTNPKAMVIFAYGWWYVLLKVAELLDTLFFVLRKKDSHISFLHVLHHTLALVTVWLDVNMGVMGQVALFPLLNCSVHVLMYTYYGLSALAPEWRPSLWWKKHVTQFQIFQFLVLTLHALIPVLHECGFPRRFACFMAAEAALFCYLFSDFYVRTYRKDADRCVKNR